LKWIRIRQNDADLTGSESTTLGYILVSLVAELRIQNVYPGLRIPDPKTATKERGDKKIVVIPFFVATNFTKLKILLCLKC
jgi:hypothetical protein